MCDCARSRSVLTACSQIPLRMQPHLVTQVRFVNVTGHCSFDGCAHANRSQCFNLTVQDSKGCVPPASASDPLPPQMFACKRNATTMFGHVNFPWGVCIPLDAPVNMDPTYPNWGPAVGRYASLAECNMVCA